MRTRSRVRARKVLDFAASLAMLLAAAVLIYIALGRDRKQTLTTTVETIERLDVGDRLDREIPGQLETATLFVWVQTSCRFCTASMDFYRRIMTIPQKKVRVVVLGAESVETLRTYLREHRFEPDDVLQTNSPELRRFGTPALFLTAQDSTIERIWVGQLSAGIGEAEVLKVITAG